MKNIINLLFACFVMASCKEDYKQDYKQEIQVEVMEDKGEAGLQRASVLFYKALANADAKTAITIANSLDFTPTKIDKTYKELFNQCGMTDDFLVAPKFTILDFLYWQQVWLFKEESRKLAKDLQVDEDIIRKCYDKVRERISGEFEGPDPTAYPIDIWRRKYGVCDRQSWVMCELAYQLGAEVFIIYFIDPKTKKSHHTICEILYNGEKYIVDPLYGKFLKGTHLRDIGPEKLKIIWDEYPGLYGGLKQARIYSPSMPFDYTMRQQAMSIFLQGVTPEEDVMRFGERPEKRINHWPYQKGDNILYWDFPIRMIGSSKIYIKNYSQPTD